MAEPDTLTVWHNSKLGLGQFEEVPVPLFDGRRPLWIEHPELKSKADFVAIPISTQNNIVLYPYEVASLIHMQVEPAQKISVVGFPFGERTGASFAVWATGYIASEPEINHGGRPVFLIDCRSRPGQSGSPVIRHRGRNGTVSHDNGVEEITPVSDFLGIYSGRIHPDSDLGTVWKAYAIAELLAYANSLSAAP